MTHEIGAFGGWDAPYTDDMDAIATPVGEKCVYCDEPVQRGDAGAITASMGVHHRECSFRSVMGGIGHYVDHARYCKGELGTDAGLSRRESALLVWAMYHGALPGGNNRAAPEIRDSLTDTDHSELGDVDRFGEAVPINAEGIIAAIKRHSTRSQMTRGPGT